VSDKRGARVRAAAAEAVHAVAEHGRSLDAELRRLEVTLPAQDQPLFRNLAYGVVRRWYLYREWLDVLVDRRPRRRDRIVEALLCLGFHQLTATRIPDHAVVSATVEAARLLGKRSYAGLINAVLRRFRREDVEHREPDSDEARYNHPDWLLARFRTDWPDDAASIVEANNARAPMWLRINRLRFSLAEYESRLTEAGIASSRLAGLPSALRLGEPLPVADLPGFAAGDVSVQDGGAQVAADWLLADGGGRVLDACAAPGGKTAHLLEIGEVEVDAIDVDDARLAAVDENLSRLGLDATLRAADAGELGSWWDGRPYDRILLDAPCSATGVIRRHTDIKLLRRDSDIASLARTQATLLDRLWQTLKPGGRLLYVTCSVLAEENESVAAGFLERTADASVSSLLPNNNIRALMQSRGPGYQLRTGTGGMDGFYFAAIDKRG
jgi:16S rRNA (cytosine967-C5)-methyltransferase